MRTALLVGASGLVGSYVLKHLLDHPGFEKVKVLSRRPLNFTHPKLQMEIASFDNLADISDAVFQVTDTFSCLGTTTLKRSGDPTHYRKIEVDYPVQIARRVLSAGAKSFHYVSAIGSSSQSFIPYSRMKGQAEDGLLSLQREFPNTYVACYRPCFISGPRVERRILEEIALPVWSFFEPLMVGSFRKYRSIHAEAIAKAMIYQISASPGFFLIEGDRIESLSKQFASSEYTQ